jgi:trehalose synthase
VIEGLARHLSASIGAHLVYAGPAVEARSRIRVVTLPMDDEEENAVIVNALQRHARVVIQKSLAEGFGLTLA